MKNNIAELAWETGDRPAEAPEFTVKVPDETLLQLIEALPDGLLPVTSCKDIQVSAMFQPRGLVGRYRLDYKGSDSIFIRVTKRIGEPELESAVIRHLLVNGVNVNPLLLCGHPAINPDDKERLRIDASHIIPDAKHFSGQLSEMEMLGDTLSKLHHALSKFPLADVVKQNSTNRFNRLVKISDHLKNDPIDAANKLTPFSSWIISNSSWINEVSHEISPLSMSKSDDAQCVHGEPHPANVLFTDNKAVLIDFEESVHLHVSPGWDMAFAVQRFIYADHIKKKSRKNMLAALCNGYGKEVFDPLAMREVAWTTLLIIFDLWLEYRIITSTKECEKFLLLEKQARLLS